MMKLLAEWLEFVTILKRHGVRFLIVGAHAVAAHGRPRATEDFDVLVEPTPANAKRVSAAIAEFGFRETGRDWRWFAKPYRIVMMGELPFRIDVLTSISGVSFKTAWRNRSSMPTDVGDVGVIGLADLRANKKAAGRTKDLLDLALLDELELAKKPTRAASRSRSTRRRPVAARSRKPGTAKRRG
ncbi:MAG: hypothetical protein JWO36_2885 [Myxococcales bacterium]|nr:hypothetical protein [Myxococcales bacterium]